VSNVEVDTASLNRAMTQLAGCVERIAQGAKDAARTQGQTLLDTVEVRVPKVSGAMAGSLALFTVDDGVEVGYDGSVPYAAWIEFGGSRGRPRIAMGRYLYPTAQGAEQPFVAAMERAAEQEIAHYPWS